MHFALHLCFWTLVLSACGVSGVHLAPLKDKVRNIRSEGKPWNVAVEVDDQGSASVEQVEQDEVHIIRNARKQGKVAVEVHNQGSITALGEATHHSAPTVPVLMVFGTDGTQKWEMTYDTANKWFLDNRYFLQFKDASEAPAFLDGTFTQPVEMVQGGLKPDKVTKEWSNAGGLHLNPDGKVTRRPPSTSPFHANEAEFELISNLLSSVSPPLPAEPASPAPPNAPAPSPPSPPNPVAPAAPNAPSPYFWGPAEAGTDCPGGQSITTNADECKQALKELAGVERNFVSVWEWKVCDEGGCIPQTSRPPGCFVAASVVDALPDVVGGMFFLNKAYGTTNNGNFRALCWIGPPV